MLLKFCKVTIHNFLSYGHSEIELTKKGYCLVKGVNNCPRDRATSNGAGKSSWSSAICWALTGETIQGLSSNVKNINIDEDSCYVKLDFYADKDFYEITRYKNPKSDLKIVVNGSDISGKGIKESENILAQHLPDLTSQLIASIIILGQGLPNKFTANSPSKRKEILEQLSKSDFMIEDIKKRILNRQSALSSQLRIVEDSILSKSSKKDVLTSQLDDCKRNYAVFSETLDYDNLISDQQKIVDTETKLISDFQSKISDAKSKLSSIGTQLNEKLQNKTNALLKSSESYNKQISSVTSEINNINFEINSLQKNITAAKKITDICPTCGQKLPNVFKPDTSKDEERIAELKTKLLEVNNQKIAIDAMNNQTVNDINEDYRKDSAQLNLDYKKYQDMETMFSNEIYNRNQKVLSAQAAISKLTIQRDTFEQQKRDTEKKIKELELEISSLDKDIKDNTASKLDVNSHIEAINKINTFVKRDFRGILLQNVISYIQIKAKSYASEIFGTDNLVFNINGNNIEISYCGKAFENLSGGEKQKCDLIIQFAIRDMMEKYLNFSSNILVLDEVFDALDTCSCSSVIQLISDKATDVESVFVVSHRADELELPVDCEMVIVKDEDGISNIMEGN